MDSDVSVTRLAATHAALDSERRGWRGDILVSAIVEVLTPVEALRAQELTPLINRLWGTDVVAQPLVESALSVAKAAYLVTEDENGYWRASDDARREARSDRDWADAMLRRAEADFRARLDDICEKPIKEERLPSLFHHFQVALMAGAEGMYRAVADSVTPERLRPVRFEPRRIAEYLGKEIQPKWLIYVMTELAAAAANPDDDFADELVRLIMVGNILHGLLTRRDVPDRPSLEGTRGVIDTSVLVYLVDEATYANEVFVSLVDQSRKAGVQLVVAEHTLEEWERLWQAGDAEIVEADRFLGGSAYVLIQNPFVRAYLRLKDHDPNLRWKHFQIGRRDIRKRLETFGVQIRPHGNNRDADSSLASDMHERLMELSKNTAVRGRRSHSTADADAQSCAMVARWREKTGAELPAGWFIATDTLTRLAYEGIRPADPYPIVVTAETWLLFLAHMTIEDAATLGRLAKAISDVAARQGFISIATSYTVEEAIKLSGLLSEGDVLSNSDLEAAVTMDFVGLVEESDDERSGRLDLNRRAATLMRRRSARRDARAHREEERASAERQERADEIRTLQGRADGLQDALRTVSDSRDDSANELSETRTKYRRALGSVISGAVLIIGLVVAAVTGAVAGVYLALSVVLVVTFACLAYRYATNPAIRLVSVLISFVLSSAWLAAAILIELLVEETTP